MSSPGRQQAQRRHKINTRTYRAVYGSPLSPFHEQPSEVQERRSVPFDEEPGFYDLAKLWLYGNARILDGNFAFVEAALWQSNQHACNLDEIEREAERLVLDGKVLVCGIHNFAHMRSAVVPLRWGSPTIVILSGGFQYHMGDDFSDELFATARLWRYKFDPVTDLVVSRRAPEKKPTFATYNPTVDRMIKAIAECSWPGIRSPYDQSYQQPLFAS